MTSERTQGLVFGEVADEFDRIRPGYPADLVKDVLTYTGAHGLDIGLGALEIGAGTGKATSAFTQHGVAVTAIEPDQAMAALLAQRLPDVAIELTSFERFVSAQRFGLLYCAQAWHWTEPSTRWQSASAALAPGGTLALFWNYDRIADDGQRAAVREVVAEHAPQLLFEFDDEPAGDQDLATLWPGTDIVRQPDFADLATHLYLWERTISAGDYVAYLGTHSTFRMLAEPVRDRLFAAIEDRLAVPVTLAVETVLYLARRTG